MVKKRIRIQGKKFTVQVPEGTERIYRGLSQKGDFELNIVDNAIIGDVVQFSGQDIKLYGAIFRKKVEKKPDNFLFDYDEMVDKMKQKQTKEEVG